MALGEASRGEDHVESELTKYSKGEEDLSAITARAFLGLSRFTISLAGKWQQEAQ